VKSGLISEFEEQSSQVRFDASRLSVATGFVSVFNGEFAVVSEPFEDPFEDLLHGNEIEIISVVDPGHHGEFSRGKWWFARAARVSFDDVPDLISEIAIDGRAG
jgi:hypothetical protein